MWFASEFDAVAIGSVTKDTFLQIESDLVACPEAPLQKAFMFPLGEKLDVQAVVETPGGNAANASVTFARQGFKTACIGSIGDDRRGKDIVSALEKEGVAPLFSAVPDMATACSTLLLQGGERTILGYHGASNALAAHNVPWKKMKARWWYVSLAGESDVLLNAILDAAAAQGINVAFNPSGYHIRHRRAEILEALKRVAVLFVNAGEAAELAGVDIRKEKEAFTALDGMTPGIVAITDGPAGAKVSDGSYIYSAGIFKEKRLLDRTGAGDAFGSGFVAGLMKRSKGSGSAHFKPEDIEYAMRLASANATAVVEEIGATPGILTAHAFESGARFRHLDISRQPL